MPCCVGPSIGHSSDIFCPRVACFLSLTSGCHSLNVLWLSRHKGFPVTVEALYSLVAVCLCRRGFLLYFGSLLSLIYSVFMASGFPVAPVNFIVAFFLSFFFFNYYPTCVLLSYFSVFMFLGPVYDFHLAAVSHLIPSVVFKWRPASGFSVGLLFPSGSSFSFLSSMPKA